MGRPKGALGKKTREQIAAIEASGETPLDYMLRIMRDPTQDHERRDRMAASAAPYVHARLAVTDNRNEVTHSYVAVVPPKAETVDEWQQQHAPMLQ